MLQHAVVSPASGRARTRRRRGRLGVDGGRLDELAQARRGGRRIRDRRSHRRPEVPLRGKQIFLGVATLPAVRRSLSFFLLAACLVAGVLSAGLLVGTPSADAQEGTTTGTTTAPPPPPTTTTTTTTTTTPTVPRPTTIAAGVTVGGELLVGGLSPADATKADQVLLRPPLMLTLGKVTLTVTPKQLGASAYVGDAIKHARVFAPGANVPLKVAAPRQRLERYAQRSRSASIVPPSTPS